VQDGKPEKQNWLLMRGIWISAATIRKVRGRWSPDNAVAYRPTRREEANEIEIGNFNTPQLSVYESEGAHSGVHVTGGNRNGYSLGAKCSCRQFGRSAKSDSSVCGDGQEHNREDAVSGFVRPNFRPKTITAGVCRCNLLPPVYLNAIDATVLTVEPRGNDWAALVLEKLEGEIKDNSGKTMKIYVIGVVRDGWGKLNDNQWTLLWSEQLGQQLWEEKIPPIANW
jgi:hypothetical protein